MASLARVEVPPIRIVMVGPRVTVWLNGEMVVDDAVMENYFDRSRPIFPTGPIQLQTHCRRDQSGPCSHFYISGRSTLLMTWMTPFVVSMSAVVTWASSIMTLPSHTFTSTLCPLTVSAELSSTTSSAMTFPETT